MTLLPRGIDELVLPELPPDVLLHVEDPRDTPDLEFAGFGFGRVPALALQDASGVVARLSHALVVALHSADEQPDPDREIDLDFELDVDGEPMSVLVPLSLLLARRLPALASAATDVVLALCNPRHTPIAAPPGLRARLWWADGDVDSWLDVDDAARPSHRLVASRWHTEAPAPA